MDNPNQIQYLFDNNGQKTLAVLPVDLLERLLNYYEELQDIKVYDEAKNSKTEFIPLDQMLENFKSFK